MNILIANDDGIEAEGIRRLVEAVATRGDVYVSAPHTQRSAAGHSITVHEEIEILETDFPKATAALQTTGTPADCVKMGIQYYKIKGVEMDMVFSGINHGGNLGTDTLYSGTVSAAIEGMLCGLPAIAVSINHYRPVHFDYACELAVDTMDKMAGSVIGARVLNINTPDRPREEIKGVRFTHLGVRDYEEWFEPEDVGDGAARYRYQGRPVVYDSKDIDIDVIADQEGYASITPLQFDLTDHVLLEQIRKGNQFPQREK